MIKELRNWIATEAGLTVGTDLHLGVFPQGAGDVGTAIRETGGPHKPESDGRGTFAVQALSRGVDYSSAREAAYAVFDVMLIRGEVSLPVLTSGEEWIVESILPVNRPQHLGPDGSGLQLFSANYRIHVKGE